MVEKKFDYFTGTSRILEDKLQNHLQTV